MYPLITVPAIAVQKSFSDFSKKDTETYFQWFVHILPERLNILAGAVCEEYPEFDLDFSRKSLSILYIWFSKQVCYRPMTLEEKAEIEQQLERTPGIKQAISIDERVLDAPTVSICFDTGLYFARTLQTEVPGLEWTPQLKPKSHVDIGQPVLTSLQARVPLNPRRIMEVQAAKILDGINDDIAFVRLLDVWKQMFLPK